MGAMGAMGAKGAARAEGASLIPMAILALKHLSVVADFDALRISP